MRFAGAHVCSGAKAELPGVCCSCDIYNELSAADVSIAFMVQIIFMLDAFGRKEQDRDAAMYANLDVHVNIFPKASCSALD